MAQTLSECPTCGFPVKANHAGELATCFNCGQKMEAIESPPTVYPEWWGKAKEGLSQDVAVPRPLLIGVLTFLGGMLFGPSIIASTQGGKAWLERQARGR